MTVVSLHVYYVGYRWKYSCKDQWELVLESGGGEVDTVIYAGRRQEGGGWRFDEGKGSNETLAVFLFLVIFWLLKKIGLDGNYYFKEFFLYLFEPFLLYFQFHERELLVMYFRVSETISDNSWLPLSFSKNRNKT